MKKALIYSLIIIIFIELFTSYQKSTAKENAANDTQIVQQVKAECEYIVRSNYIYRFGQIDAWHTMQLAVIHQRTEDVYKKMESDLGEDFPTKLSNGDYIYLAFFPVYGSYKIYAGGMDDENMLYPEWNYTKLEEPENFSNK